jgi:hypothetical protein
MEVERHRTLDDAVLEAAEFVVVGHDLFDE